jgi:uncharacterized protein
LSAHPAPFRQFVLKIHSRCDLACDHCYMYEAADQGWRRQPRVMSLETAEAIGRRIAEHSAENRLELIRIIFHGGEPLLTGSDRLRAIIEALRNPLLALSRPPRMDLRIHTNAVQLDTDFCELFDEYDIRVGVSLDGDKTANDRHRRYADGRSSHAKVLSALELLRTPRYRHLYAGILCTVDIANDPATVYRALAAEAPPRIDLLLPHATWNDPPPRPDGVARPSTLADPAYAEWLWKIFRIWDDEGRPFGIRLFDSVLSTLHGGPPLTEALGLAPSDVLVIATGGEIEQTDSLKIAFDGASDTGLRVQDHPLSTAAAHAQIIARQNGPEGLSAQCRACPVLSSCGGGLFSHRFREQSSDAGDPAAVFRNPTVYCADLFTLITGIDKAERARTSASARLSVDSDHFDQLTSGYGGAAAIASLADAESHVNRVFLSAVGTALAERSDEAAAAWKLLQEIDAEQPEAVRAAVSHPFFRVWARDAIADPSAAHPATFTGYVLAAAAYAGTALELPVPADTSLVHLPGWGTIGVGSSTAAVAEGGKPVGLISESRYLGEGTSVPRVLFEDLHPAADCFQLTVLSEVAEDEFADWRSSYTAAWQIIEHRYPDYADGLRAGLKAIAPLAPSPDGHVASGTARDAFGALGVARPDDPEILALLLIHEFQHVKLGAMLDLFDLYDEADTRLYHAPWREDPRPLEGLLQGTYAHVAVVDYWRRRALQGDREAEPHYIRWRAHTWEALDRLEDSGSLTGHGRHLVQRLRATMKPWMEDSRNAECAGREDELAAATAGGTP